ncbi:uncharacterized protein LOC143019959 isoform X2 [Oratosquilla oratoria]
MAQGGPSLQMLAKDTIISLLSSLQQCNRNSQDNLRHYLMPAWAFFDEFEARCRYYHSAYLTGVFLPHLLSQGNLVLTDHNISFVFKQLSAPDVREKFSRLKYLTMDSAEETQYFNFLPRVGCLHNLTHLRLTFWCRDELLAVVGVNCPVLQVFDAKEDDCSTVTDQGLAFLTQCRTLQQVLFSNFADEYDFEDQYRYTGKGLALLLLSAPNMKRLDCSEYLLRDALRYIFQINYSKRTLPLQCLCLRNREVKADTLQIVPRLCPKIGKISIMVHRKEEEAVAAAMQAISKLYSLTISLDVGAALGRIGLSSFGHQLIFLYLDAHLLSYDDVLVISKCINLKILCLSLRTFGFEHQPAEIKKEQLFPKLEVLEMNQSVSAGIFILFNVNAPALETLFCRNACMYRPGALVKYMLGSMREGCWQQLKNLILPDSGYPTALLKDVMTTLPALQRLYVNHEIYSEQQELRQFIYRHNLNIRVDSNVNVSPPSCIYGLEQQQPMSYEWKL